VPLSIAPSKITRVDAEHIEKDGAEKYLKGVAGHSRARRASAIAASKAKSSPRNTRVKTRLLSRPVSWQQIAVIEFARNVCGLTGANSTEF